jgi:diguanylate cyclase (GGDEF)-like protein
MCLKALDHNYYMSLHNKEKPDCPVGEATCPLIDELLEQRQTSCELEQLVHTDTLTGLFNYRHFAMALERELERTRRTAQPTSMILMDLDHFKQVNDTWGHEAGNQVLRKASELIRQTLRKIDIPCRYGGEEFAIILPDTHQTLAVHAAERLREAIMKTSVAVAGGVIEFTASMGVHVYTMGDGVSAEEFVKQTDEQLYRAKEEGRNRVCYRPYEYIRTETEVSLDEKRALFE